MTALSVIIPVFNEAANLPITIAIAQTAADIEVIVVDGGSQDNTVAIAQSLGVPVIHSHPGRADQMNAGAAIAQGDTLLFLHGDTQLPKEYDQLIHETLLQPGVIAGAFELAIAGSQWGLRLVEWGVKWRSRVLQLPYGDQAIFLEADVFHQLGGFSEMPIMEDFELVQRLRKRGRIAIAPAPVTTSARRWQTLGILKTTLINQWILMAYFLGVSPATLAQWYRILK
ncbi:MAG: glycosyltransferase family 2 protein [Leptolyngbyaceae cyanobacterium RU_5_1]|nr:glycosyltransferase family 2 protein [Leptolyngbyaceae cyanobacterium RU_5_1]